MREIDREIFNTVEFTDFLKQVAVKGNQISVMNDMNGNGRIRDHNQRMLEEIDEEVIVWKCNEWLLLHVGRVHFRVYVPAVYYTPNTDHQILRIVNFSSQIDGNKGNRNETLCCIADEIV